MRRSIELPTLALGLLIYLLYVAVTLSYRWLPWPLVIVVGGLVLAWHNSLQHEAVHGHPTRSRLFNALFAGVPLSLWLPYSVYRASHLAHHASDLTDPFDDPESYYVEREQWEKLPAITRAILNVNATLLGRLLIGPVLIVIRFVWAERRMRVWLAHALMCAPVIAWTWLVCDIPLHVYVLAYVYPGLSLTLLRSYAEHRPAGDPEQRSAIVEAGSFMSLLYLYNNLHALHHAEPARAWYALPARYRERRDALLAQNGGLRYRGYADIIRRFLIKPPAPPIHRC